MLCRLTIITDHNYAALLLRALLLYEASLGNVIYLSVQCLP